MMRSFVVAAVTILLVSGLTPFERVSAQGTPPPAQVPVDIVGGVPGVSIEVFMNNGKVADVTVGGAGDASWVLDMSNMGKTKVQIYVDVCKDGKIVKVLFVTGNGQPPPKDEDCDRRLVAAGFQSDCGVTRITIDIRNWGSRIVGCGSMLSQPKVYGPILGGAAVLIGIVAGGGDSTSSFTPTTTTPPTTSTPPATTPPPSTTPPPQTPPANTTPAAPVDFNVNLVTSYNHPGGNTSLACGLLSTTPPQNTSASYTTQISGPNVVSGGTSSGFLNAAGRAAFQAVISSIGSYNFMVTVVSGGQTRTASGSVNVTSANNTCPTP
jgi:hypothetical protein